MRAILPCSALVLLAGCVTLPEGTGLTLTPDAPTTTESLSASLTGDTGDAEKVTWTWSWQKDGEIQADLTGAEVPSDRTAKGQTWTVSAVATAGKKEGTALTAEVTILNTAPVSEGVSLAPASPTTADAITATATASDADGDALTWAYEWAVNGTAIAGQATDTLPSSLFEKEDVISVTATPTDGESSGEPVVSSTLTIVNSPPEPPTVVLTPEEPTILDDLVCSVSTEGTDLDDDRINYRVSWTLDGVAYAGPTQTTVIRNDTINADQTEPGQVWACLAVSNDGTADSAASAPSNSSEVQAPTALFPGLTDYAFTHEGFSVRCHAWEGKVCVHAQMAVDCGTCGDYEACGEWHDTTNQNNGENRTPLNFCAIATGDPTVSAVGWGGTAGDLKSCGWSASTHPICQTNRATVHYEDSGIESRLGLLLDSSYCGFDDDLIHIQCGAW